jgi:hypothetical protein
MKKILVFAVLVACLFVFVGPSFAADKMLTAKIQSVTQAVDKNGAPYTRVIVAEQRTLNGVTYEAGIPAMAFGAVAKDASLLKEGGTLKAIVSEREFNGRTSYTIMSVLK